MCLAMMLIGKTIVNIDGLNYKHFHQMNQNQTNILIQTVVEGTSRKPL